MIQFVINSVVQIFLFSLVPFVFWYFKSGRKEKFTRWIGLKSFKINKQVIIMVLFVVLGFTVIDIFALKLVDGVKTATSVFEGMGLRAIPSILMYAIFNTALPEEILFRGFILKRLQEFVGFNKANIIRSVIFGFLHGLMFFRPMGIFKALVIVVFTGVFAYFMGYINEKQAEGSILPGVFIHSLANILAGLAAAF